MKIPGRLTVHLVAAIASIVAIQFGDAAIGQEQASSGPKAEDWANIAQLPDWSGVWAPGPLDPPALVKHPWPAWTPAAAARIATLQRLEAEHHPVPIYANCLPEGMPSFVVMSLNVMEILFTPGRVTILGEFDGNRLRRIYTDGRGHPADPDLTFNGHSIGHWDGDTLVVDTVGILPQAFIPLGQAVAIPNNGGMHIVEHIRLIDPNTLRDDMEVTAPKVLTETWKTSRTYKRKRGPSFDIVEASCRQGDFTEDTDKFGYSIFKVPPKPVARAQK